MSLRDECLLVICMMSEAKMEKLFKRKAIAEKYEKVTSSKKVTEKRAKVLEELAELREKIEEELGMDKDIEKITTTENIDEVIWMNVMVNAMEIAIESIIFDGKSPEQAISEIITVDLMLEILDGAKEKLIESCCITRNCKLLTVNLNKVPGSLLS